MVTKDQLDALDLVVWLGTTQQAAQRLGCNQATVSRWVSACLPPLSLRMRRVGGTHLLSGDLDLLALERQIHQLLRLRRQEDLRLEATHCTAHLLQYPPLQGWILGSFDHHGVHRMHELLRARVVDAWISSDGFDLPADDDPELLAIPLSRWPAWLLASLNHPLAGETGVTASDLDRFPVLEFPPSIYPRMAGALADLGFGASHQRLHRYDRGSWNMQTADQVTLSFGSAVSALGQGAQARIAWNVGLMSGESLVVRRDVAGEGAVALLVQQLGRRLEALMPRCQDVTLLV